MDYEKKYKEALAKAREIHRNENEKRSDMEWLFPEIKESEDERIRKELIRETKGSEERLFEIVTNDEFVSWLEKQGYTKKDIDDAYLKGICDAKHELEKQGTPVKLDEKEIQTAKDKMFPYQENESCCN